MQAEWNTPAAKRYLLRLGGSMGLYLIVLAVTVRWFRSDTPPEGTLKYALAAAPGVPVLGAIWAMGRYIVELPDEYQRLRLAVACLWATGLTLAVCTVWGFLENFAGVVAPPLYGVFIMFMVFLGLVQGVSKTLGR